MIFLKGKQGVCFDIPTASVTEVQEKWHDSWHWQLSLATEQPELEGPWEDISGDNTRAAKVSGDSRKAVEASEDSDHQQVATKVTVSKIKARSRVLVKHSDNNLK
mgnify:CR=1 FL=1